MTQRTKNVSCSEIRAMMGVLELKYLGQYCQEFRLDTVANPNDIRISRSSFVDAEFRKL